METIKIGKFELEVEPLIRSAGNVYYVLNERHSGREFEALCKKITKVIRQDYDDVHQKLTKRRKWRMLSRSQMHALKTLAEKTSS